MRADVLIIGATQKRLGPRCELGEIVNSGDGGNENAPPCRRLISPHQTHRAGRGNLGGVSFW